MQREAARYLIQAFIIGDDLEEKSDNLIMALNLPNESLRVFNEYPSIDDDEDSSKEDNNAGY